MKKISLFLFAFSFCVSAGAQSVSARLTTAFQQFESDPQLKSALSSLYVIDSRSGKVVFEKNGTIGLAPASTQKIITSATAYELLGKDFRYKTELGVSANVNSSGPVTLYLQPSGDPTLGSWRWEEKKEGKVIGRFAQAVQKAGIATVGSVVVEARGWNSEAIPDGWIWQDIGNYYGAGATALNWRENQFDLILRSGSSISDPVTIVATQPSLYNYPLRSIATSAAKGTGDNAYIYFPVSGKQATVRGTIPVNENRFVISGALPAPATQFAYTLLDSLKGKIKVVENAPATTVFDSDAVDKKILYAEYSPVLDSIIYWFNKKSINLYGEALVKTMAYQKSGTATTGGGVKLVRDYWSQKGLEKTELNMVDGSGLSPLNRVTTHAQVTILQYAKQQPWFSGFYNALPEYNSMKMKSGTINGVKGFTGYHKAADGTEYVFSFLVNNYNGSASSLVQKMYKVLDVLK